jgi:arginyl-tRNA--protein-N-Asp/Glu arginylyltransferase
MTKYNIKNDNTIEDNYLLGLLPQRNNKNFWYQDTSSRSNLSLFILSSENRRIINKTQNYSYFVQPLSNFNYNPTVQKTIQNWLKQLGWDFPISSVKKIFTDHIFNCLYTWKNQQNEIIAYSICYFSNEISHIAYVFYNPEFGHNNLPIRLVLQTIIDSHDKKLKYCYLGRFSQKTGYYKRNMPGFEYFEDNTWIQYDK